MKINLVTTKLVALLLFSISAMAQQYPGYTLYSTMGGTTANLLDTNGNVYKTWTFTTSKKTGYSSYMLEGGVLLRTVSRTGNQFTGGPICGEVQKVDWNGNVLWDYVYSTYDYCTHHDICPMPNGNVLMIAYERKTAAEVAAAGCTGFAGEMWPDKIVEVQPTGPTSGTVVWEWKAWDHLVQNVNSSLANYQTSIVNHPELLNINYTPKKDWMHMNGLDYNDSLDQIAFSCHNLNEVYIIDHSTTMAEAASHSGGNSGKGGDILYRWGNPAAYGAAGAKILNVVHDAHWIPKGSPNAGRLACFNNGGQSSPSQKSCIDQIDLPYNGYNYTINPGAAFSPASYTSRLVGLAYSSNMGSSNQLPNGNQVVCVALSGLIYEVNAAGTTLWSKTISGSVPQAHRYSECFINGAPSTPTISQVGDTLISSASTSFQWFLNDTLIQGANSQFYQPLLAGNYSVIVTNASGCESDTSLAFAFVPTGIFEKQNIAALHIYPNPTSGLLNIDLTAYRNIDFEIRIFDMQGKLLLTKNNCKQIDLSSFENGLYNLTLVKDNQTIVNKRIMLTK